MEYTRLARATFKGYFLSRVVASGKDRRMSFGRCRMEIEDQVYNQAYSETKETQKHINLEERNN